MLLAASCSAILSRVARRASPASLSEAAAATAVAAVTRGLQTQALPDLPYDYSALEPVIPAEIMQLHHSKHHQAYVTNLNASAEKYAQAESRNDVATMLSLQPALRFNGGGHLNHSLLWKTLCSAKGFVPPSGALERAIAESFGGLDQLQARMAAAAVGVQGSGWAWLGFDAGAGGGKGQQLVVRTTANQDPLGSAFPGLVPLYGIDVWEHAYYLKYKNARPDYVREIWKVTDWGKVAALFEEAKVEAAR